MTGLVLSAALAALSSTVVAGLLEIDTQQSKFEVTVNATLHSFVCHLDRYDAAIDCHSDVTLPAKADFSFDFADLKTGNTNRDAAMLGWLGYDATPKASFHLTGWQQTGTNTVALGEIVMHGVHRTVQIPVTVKNDGETWEISGRFNLDHRDFDLPKIRKALLLTVNPSLKVKFHLVGRLPRGG
jgi:polyisoprenoid-binding protein YceI